MSTLFTDPVNEGQLWLEVAALKALTEGLRYQKIEGCSGEFDKIVHVGHSFGSSQTYTLTAMYPDISDGIVLTGFSQNGTFAAFFELGSNFIIANQVSALSKYPTGYLAPASVQGVQIDFFAPGDFDSNVLQTAYMTGQPVTPGELLTLTGATAKPNTFAGPSLVITGGKFGYYLLLGPLLINIQNVISLTVEEIVMRQATLHLHQFRQPPKCSCRTRHPLRHQS